MHCRRFSSILGSHLLNATSTYPPTLRCNNQKYFQRLANAPRWEPLHQRKRRTCPHLKADAAHGQVAVVLQHAQILGYQSSRVDQAHGGLRVALPLGMFLCHVLEPGQPQIRRCLVTLGNSEDGFRKFQRQLVSDTVFLLDKDAFFPLRVLPTCSENKRKGKHVSAQLFLFHV